jgi:hypothetical protein
MWGGRGATCCRASVACARAGSGVNRDDRLVSAALLAGAALVWLALGIVLLTLDPRLNATIVLIGAVLIGVAVALTLAPVLWITTFLRHRRIAYLGDWGRAARRAALAGLVATLLVILRSQDALNLPLAAFVMVMAVLAEVAMSMKR